jgi:hypothetical protein
MKKKERKKEKERKNYLTRYKNILP